MIAMALSCRPGLLIADEPTTALDVTIQAQILELIQRLQQELQMAVLLITHDLGVVANIADRVAVMYAGKIAEMGTWEQLYETPQHPYTVKLLESTPARDKRGTQLHTITGRVPKATDYNDGCRFADRCPKVMEGCETVSTRRCTPLMVASITLLVISTTLNHLFRCSLQTENLL